MERTNAYLFVEVQQKPVCLVCNEPIAVMKKYNLKWHNKTKNATKFNALQGQVSELKKKLTIQQFTFIKPTFEAEACVKVSCIIAKKIAAKSKPFLDGELVNECLESAAEILCPSQKQLFA